MSAESLLQALESASVEELQSLVNEHGRVPPAVYRALTYWTPMPFLDGFAVRERQGNFEAGLIRRGTGPHTGLLCFIGGKNGQDETFEQSFLHHWKADLGLDVELLPGTSWREPLDTFQYMRLEPEIVDGKFPKGLGWDRGKNSRSHVYAVVIKNSQNLRLGKKTHDLGVEATGLFWIDPTHTRPEDWGYPGMYDSCLYAWGKVIVGIARGIYRLE